MKGTLLGGKLLSPQEEQEIKEEQRLAEATTEKAEIIVQMWFKAYSDGEMTFQRYCQSVHATLSIKNIPPFERQKKLGAAVEAALKATPPKRTKNSKRSSPAGFVSLCHGLVKLVREHEKLPITRISKSDPNAKDSCKQTAYERVSELLREVGIMGVTSSTIEKNYSRLT